MAIIKIEDDKFVELKRTTFIEEKIDEVHDMQKYIINSIDLIETGLFVLCSEFCNWEDSKRRIDILCIDKNANLVVIELKRTEDGGHMDLQAIRYASMVASMTFEQAVKTYSDYVIKCQLPIDDPRETLLSFLEESDINADDFNTEVRIILISSNFHKEITTSVLWLIENGIDIKCIRLKPQRDGDNLYFDMQQIIPLPETASYQVKLREKATEQKEARRASSRDYSKFFVSINGIEKFNLNKRETMHFVISESIKKGISPEEIRELTKKRFIFVDGIYSSREAFENELNGKDIKYDPSRWYINDSELLYFNDKTYAFSNQHGRDTYELVNIVFSKHPELEGEITHIG